MLEVIDTRTNETLACTLWGATPGTANPDTMLWDLDECRPVCRMRDVGPNDADASYRYVWC